MTAPTKNTAPGTTGRESLRSPAACLLPLLAWGGLLGLAPLLFFSGLAHLPVLLLPPTLWTLRRVLRGRFLPRTPLDVSLLVLLVMTAVGATLSLDAQWSILKTCLVVLGTALFYATVDLLSVVRWQRWFPILVLLAGCGMSLLGLSGMHWASKLPQLQALANLLPGGVPGLPAAESTFNSDVVAGMIVWIVPFNLTLWAWAAGESGRRRWQVFGLSISLLLTCGTLFFTQTRGAWLGMLAGVSTLLLAGRRRWGRVLAAALVLGAAGLLFALPHTGNAWGDRLGVPRLLDPVTIDVRLELWSRAQYAIADFPLTGMGTDGFPHILPIMYPMLSTSTYEGLTHAHNEFLQTATDFGIPGLIGLLSLYGSTLWLLHRTRQKSADPFVRAVALGAVGSLIAHAATSMTGPGFLDAKPGLLFWLVLGLSVALYQHTFAIDRIEEHHA